MGHDNTVGGSAAREAQRAAAHARKLADRAAIAADRAASFAKGAEGERIAARTIDALLDHGFSLLHDRAVPPLAGNVDHIAIGHTGIWVFNTKNWSRPPKIRSGMLYAGGVPQDKTLDRCRRERDAVAALLTAGGVDPDGLVHTGLLLVGELDPATPRQIQDVGLFSLGDVVGVMVAKAPVLAQSAVDRATALLQEGCRVATRRTVQPAPTAAEFDAAAAAANMPSSSKLDERYRRRYVTSMRRGHQHKLDVYNEDGALLASKDATSGDVTLSPDVARNSLTAKLAECMTAQGFVNAKLPAVAPGSGWKRVVYAMANTNVAVLAAWRWDRGDLSRLYVHLLAPGENSVQLGHIDLGTGTVHPASNGALPGRSSTAEHLLRWVWMGHPRIR